MMPIRFIRKCLVVEAEVLDLEKIGARLEHHHLTIKVDNQFLSDCGENWGCQIADDNYDEFVDCHEASLRAAVMGALKAADELDWRKDKPREEETDV